MAYITASIMDLTATFITTPIWHGPMVIGGPTLVMGRNGC
jgi:hypothetical protein